MAFNDDIVEYAKEIEKGGEKERKGKGRGGKRRKEEERGKTCKENFM